MKVYRCPQVEPQVNSAAGRGLSAGYCAIMLLCLSPLWAIEPIDEYIVSVGNTAPAGQSNPPNHLSMFLEVTDSKAGSSEWSCFVSHRLSVVNQKFEGDRYNTFICSSASRRHQDKALHMHANKKSSPASLQSCLSAHRSWQVLHLSWASTNCLFMLNRNVNQFWFSHRAVSKESQNRYSKSAKDWGWREFLQLHTLFDQEAGFLVSDSVVFAAEVLVLKEVSEVKQVS